MKEYKGKPLAYLDHNILDFFIKNKETEFEESLKEQCQIVFSDESLQEIKRSVGYEKEFLEVLKRIEANYIKIILEQPGFVITDRVQIDKVDIELLFNQYCQNDSLYAGSLKAFNQFSFKLSGGKKGTGISDINNEMLLSFKKLMNGLINSSQELGEIGSKDEELLRSLCVSLEEDFEASLNELEKNIKKNVDDDVNWNPIKDLRDQAKLGPRELNNIAAPRVLEKIWKEYKKVSLKDHKELDLETFFGLRKNPINPKKPYFTHQKITNIYGILNAIGYWPDSKVDVERRFMASMSDNSHASIASFCDFLFSADRNLVKKVFAAYEYLGVITKVYHVDFDKS